jgi:hypothetical protein
LRVKRITRSLGVWGGGANDKFGYAA